MCCSYVLKSHTGLFLPPHCRTGSVNLIPKPHTTAVWERDHPVYSSLVSSSPCWRGPWWRCPGCWGSCWCSLSPLVSPPPTLTGRGAQTQPSLSGLVYLRREMQILYFMCNQVLLLRSSQDSNSSLLDASQTLWPTSDHDQPRIDCLWIYLLLQCQSSCGSVGKDPGFKIMCLPSQASPVFVFFPVNFSRKTLWLREDLSLHCVAATARLLAARSSNLVT